MRVLVVEDEDALAQVVSRGLRREGGGRRLGLRRCFGLEKALVTPCDVNRVCRRLAAAGNETNILMLTAAGLLQDKVTGLNLGADGYLVKPFAFEELVARLCALARRAGQPRTAG